MKMNVLAGQKIKIGKTSITVKDDNGKCGNSMKRTIL